MEQTDMCLGYSLQGEELVKYNQNIVMLKDEAKIWLMRQVARYINIHNVYSVRTQEARAISDEFVAHFHLNTRNDCDNWHIAPEDRAMVHQPHGFQSKIPKNVRQPMTPALLTFPGPPLNVHAKDVFATARRTEITSAMNTRRIAEGVSTQHNTCLYALERDAMFDALTDSKKHHWHEMANQQNSHKASSPSNSDVYS
ncbi:hypothetical protein K439DRAFT_1622573 [Ramaria rubella]|nr:hypothetical protein K439DRAFT_1622573 [Ramaria rubella]